jgi:hypothetical protein
MNLKRFKEIVEAYGADPARWPARERAAAEAFLASSSEARQLREAEARLDDVLDRATAVAAAPGLAARIRRTALANDHGSRASGAASSWFAELWEGPIWRPAAALAASMVLGLAVGAFAPLFPNEDDSVAEEIVGFWLDADDTGWDG